MERGADNKAVPVPEIDYTVAPTGNRVPHTHPGWSLAKLATPGARVFKIAYHNPDCEEVKSRTLFFWAQEPDTSQDEALLAAANTALSTPADPAVPVAVLDSADYESDSRDMDSLDDDDGGVEGRRPRPLTAAQLQAALAGCGLRPTPAAARAATTRQRQGSPGRETPPPSRRRYLQPVVDAATLAAALQAATASREEIGHIAAVTNLGAVASARRALAHAPGPSLAEALRPDALRPLLTSDAALEALSLHLPEGHRSIAGLLDVVSSAQWRAQLDTLSAAFTTAQLDVSQFGLTVQGYAAADLLQAVQDAVDEEKKKKAEEAEGGK